MTDAPSQAEVLQGISDDWKNRDRDEPSAPVQDDMSEPEPGVEEPAVAADPAPTQAKAAPRAKVVKAANPEG